jgi:hypothetical protein
MIAPGPTAETVSRAMPTTGKIFGAIIAMKREVGAVGKNGQVTEYGKYDYRRFDDVLDVVAPLMNEYGIMVVSTVLSKEERQDGKKHFVTITMSYRLYAEDGSYVDGSQVGEAFDVGDKAATKAQTVALRIFYCTTFNIPYNEMKDSEAGQQHEWSIRQSPFERLIAKLKVMQNPNELDGVLNYAIGVTKSKAANGDSMTREELSRTKASFVEAAKRLTFTEQMVKQIADRIDSEVSGNPQTTTRQKLAVEPVRFRELNLDFGVAKDTEARERCVMTLLQSRTMGSITEEEFATIVNTYCLEDDTNGRAWFLLGYIFNAGTASEIAGMSASVHADIQQNKIGRDVGNSLSKYAQTRIEKMGDENGDA